MSSSKDRMTEIEDKLSTHARKIQDIKYEFDETMSYSLRSRVDVLSEVLKRLSQEHQALLDHLGLKIQRDEVSVKPIEKKPITATEAQS